MENRLLSDSEKVRLFEKNQDVIIDKELQQFCDSMVKKAHKRFVKLSKIINKAHKDAAKSKLIFKE